MSPLFFFFVQTWVFRRVVFLQKCLSPPVPLYNIFCDNWQACRKRLHEDVLHRPKLLFTFAAFFIKGNNDNSRRTL